MVDTWNAAQLNEAVANGSIGGGEGATTLSALTDVSLTTPTGGDLLSYDGVSSKWVNTAPDAENISYDNTDSGLTATDVQAAIDELSSEKLDKAASLTQIINIDNEDLTAEGYQYGKTVAIRIQFKVEKVYAQYANIIDSGKTAPFSQNFVGTNTSLPNAYLSTTGKIQSNGGTYTQYSTLTGTFLVN